MNPTREKISKKYPWSKNPTRENSRKSAREAKFFAREKYGKNPKIGREKKKVGVRKVKKAEKSGREKQILPVKIFEKMPKNGFTPTFEFHAQKKKHWAPKPS